ncbi:MAG: class I SAM-dependent methyltransferase [Pyrinomonadaceae bacterium]
MSHADRLRAVVAEGRTIRTLEDGIYSVLPDGVHNHLYDRRAALYDLAVGTRLYNRVMWGASPGDYVAFARRAVGSQSSAPMLDAGCGSMLFTAPAYLESRRPIIGFDQSLKMLRRARTRLLGLAGSMPDQIILLQADLNDLPFRPTSFGPVLCLNVLHQFAEAVTLIQNLKALLTPGGQLYLTSLVSNRRFVGDRYLDLLYRAGEFVRPRSSMALKKLLSAALNSEFSYHTKGNMAYATAVAYP